MRLLRHPERSEGSPKANASHPEMLRFAQHDGGWSRSIALVLALLIATIATAAPEKWWDAYARGVAAVNAKNYKLAADSSALGVPSLRSA
jgi:hypothetical protein